MFPLRKTDTASTAATTKGDAPRRIATQASGASARAELPASALSATQRDATLLLHTVLLSGVAGYVDAAGFVALLGFFPAHLTGELVGDAIAISSGQLTARAARLWMFPVFVLSIVLSSLVARFLRQRKQCELTGLLGLLTASLALFSACDAIAHLLHHRHLPVWFSGACAVTAMGFQTALIRESLTGSCPTTVMTGNLVQVIVELLDQVVSPKTLARSVRQRTRLVSVCGALLAFGSCATLGGWLTQHLGTASVVLPAFVTAALTARAWAEDRAQAARVAAQAPPAPWFCPDDDFWPDSSETEALAPLYGVESVSVTRIKNEPRVPEVGLPEGGVAGGGVPERDIVAVGIAEVGIAEVGIAEVGIAEVGIAEVGIAEPPRYASGIRRASWPREK